MNLKNLQIDSVISAGSFGSVVYKSRMKESLTNYAVKRFPKPIYENSSDMIRGIRYLKQLSTHPHILQLIGLQSSDNNVWIMYEYCAGGSLDQLLMTEGTLMLPACKSILRDLACALEHLNKLGIVHGSIRPGCLLLTENGVVKLSSFEGARLIGGEPLLSGMIKYPKYASPEVHKAKPASSGMDVWSMGCVGFEIFLGFPPFSGTTLEDIKESVFEDEVIIADTAEEFHLFILGLLEKEEANRLSVVGLCDHAKLRGAFHPTLLVRDSSISAGGGDHEGMLSLVKEEEEEEEEEEESTSIRRSSEGGTASSVAGGGGVVGIRRYHTETDEEDNEDDASL